MLLDEALQLFGSDPADRGRCPEDGPAERMPCVQIFLESVVDLVCGGIFVRMDLIDDDSFLSLDLLVRKNGFGCELEKESGRLRQVLLEHGGVQDDLLLGGKGIELTPEPVQIAVDHRCALVRGTLEECMLREMRYAAVVPFFVAGTAAYAQRAVTYRETAFPYGVAESAFSLSRDHPLSSGIDGFDVLWQESGPVARIDAVVPEIHEFVGIRVNEHLVAP